MQNDQLCTSKCKNKLQLGLFIYTISKYINIYEDINLK